MDKCQCGNKVDKRSKKKTGLCRDCYIKSVNTNGEAKCITCGGKTSEPRAEYCKPCWLNRPVEGRKTTYRKYQLKKKYKLTFEQYDEMLAAQGGKCAICLTDYTELSESLYVDHNRKCCPSKESCGNCVRGLLCRQCNFAIGLLKDNEVIIKTASDYVKKHNEKVGN